MNRGDVYAALIGISGLAITIITALLVISPVKNINDNPGILVNYAPASVTFIVGLIMFAWSIYFIWPVKKDKEMIKQ